VDSTAFAPGQAPAARGGVAAATRILRRLLGDFHDGAGFRLGNQEPQQVGAKAPRFTLVVEDSAVVRELVLQRSALRLADAYIRGLIDFEGDLYAALGLKQHFKGLRLGLRDQLALLRDALRLPRRPRGHDSGSIGDGFGPAGGRPSFQHRHSRQSDREAIAFHYDTSNDFYRLWLDEQMVYSCAVFQSPQDSLDQAQRNKLDLICRKLRLRSGERLLDIGCGWGALVCWAARHYGVKAHGITLSRNQLEAAQARIEREGLQDRVSVELRDYRDLPGDGAFDKISSIGMFEHVGLARLANYNATVHRLLRPGGLFLNHGITRDEEGWKRTEETLFINRYVFPDAEIDILGNIVRGMELAGFEIHDVEGLRPHYAQTLRHWVARLESARAAALQRVGEARYRTWRLYMAACALQFETGALGVHQILASRPGAGPYPLPLTRHDLYR
jgi:cyclopropane-fatty-acyl-phospholipid synthase